MNTILKNALIAALDAFLVSLESGLRATEWAEKYATFVALVERVISFLRSKLHGGIVAGGSHI